MNPEIQCSRCGKSRKVSLNPDSRDYVGKVAKSWSTTGYVIYCPKCTKEINSYTTDYSDVLEAICRWMHRDYESQIKHLKERLSAAEKRLVKECGPYWRYD